MADVTFLDGPLKGETHDVMGRYYQIPVWRDPALSVVSEHDEVLSPFTIVTYEVRGNAAALLKTG